MSRTRVGVVGATGILGGELVRLLAQHPQVDLAAACASKSAGKTLHEVRPSLRGAGSITIDSFDAERLAEHCDIVFLALPHGTSASAAAALLQHDLQVIDLGSDFRLRQAADVQRYYGHDPQYPELLEEAVYSLPEITGPLPSGTRLVANPRCIALSTNTPSFDSKNQLVSPFEG